MQFGAHLPLIGFDDAPWTLDRLRDYTRTARELGFTHLAANDHLIFQGPWLDGPTALAATLGESAGMQLVTSVAIPVVRGPVQSAKTLAALSLLSGGRLTVGVGPGSSPLDYGAVGIPFDERWPRLTDIIPALRALCSGHDYAGKFYTTAEIKLEPRPQPPPEIWIGSWGSDAGLSRTARLGDGWLASAYNTTPALFAEAHSKLATMLDRHGKHPAAFPNALATTLMYITESATDADRVLRQVIAPIFRRPLEDLAERLLVGPAEHCAEKLRRYAAAGLQTVLVWPVADELSQLERFRSDVTPLV